MLEWYYMGRKPFISKKKSEIIKLGEKGNDNVQDFDDDYMSNTIIDIVKKHSRAKSARK